MNKKLIASVLAVLSVSFLFASCGKKDSFKKEETQNYEPIEFTTNTEGDKFILNAYGDLIPVTTGKDGSMELVDDLYTKPKEQADKEVESVKQEEAKHPVTEENNTDSEPGNTSTNPNSENGNTPTPAPTPTPTPTPTPEDTTTRPNTEGGLQIGSEPDANRDAVMHW